MIPKMKAKKDPYANALARLCKKEQKQLAARTARNAPLLSRVLADRLPDRLQNTLRQAFLRAFETVFTHGGGIIDKTFSAQKRKTDYDIRRYTASLRPSKKNLHAFSKDTANIRRGNTALSAAFGTALGFLGIGLPDIPLFVGVLLKNIYETALANGFDYRSQGEQYFILLLIESALSCGEAAEERERTVDAWIDAHRVIPAGTQREVVFRDQMTRTAYTLADAVLYMKFIQGIPIIGAAGGISDAVCVSDVGAYAALKYERRRLTQSEYQTTNNT